MNVREQFWLNDFVRTHLTGKKENTWKINIERSFLMYCYSFMWSITHHNWSCSSPTCKTTLCQPSWVLTRNLHFQKRDLHMIQEAPILATRRQHTTATPLTFTIFLNMFYTIHIVQNYIWSYSQDLVGRGKVFYCQIHVTC